jgi:hypothetical protein
MSRRASLPGADELFRSTTPALTAVRDTTPEIEPSSIIQNPTTPVTRSQSKSVRTTPRRRVSSVDRSPSGRESHAEKITVYLSPEELFDLDQARLAADRGRIVRESIAVIIADLEAKGEQSILARRLRGL